MRYDLLPMSRKLVSLARADATILVIVQLWLANEGRDGVAGINPPTKA